MYRIAFMLRTSLSNAPSTRLFFFHFIYMRSADQQHLGFPRVPCGHRGQTELSVGCDGTAWVEAVRHCMTEGSDFTFVGSVSPADISNGLQRDYEEEGGVLTLRITNF